MSGTNDRPWTALFRKRAVTVLLLGGLLGGVGSVQTGVAQSPSPDSSEAVRPPGVEQVRQRIEEIRQTPTQWRRRLGERLSPEAPSRPERPLSIQLQQQEGGPTRADLRRVERRLQALIRQVLASEYGGDLPAQELAEQFRFHPPDTIRVAAPIRDTVTVADTTTVSDSVRIVRDTVRETRVEQVERLLLDQGVFRAFEVNFAFGESTLQPRATRTLNAVGDVLHRYPDLRIAIAGHTDAVGPEAFNQRLSEARAEAVRAYLLDRFEVSAQRLMVRGYGETRPIASNKARSGRALNRRVEFRVLNPESVP